MIDTDQIREAVISSEKPLTDACQVIGAMLDVIANVHGSEVVEAFIAKLNADLPPRPDHAATEL